MKLADQSGVADSNGLTGGKLSNEDAPIQFREVQSRAAQSSERKTYSDLPRELQDKIIKLLISARPSPKIEILPGKLEIFADDVRTAIMDYCTANDGVLLTGDSTMINEFRETGVNLLGSVKHDIASFQMLDEFCGCMGAIRARNGGYRPHATVHIFGGCLAASGARAFEGFMPQPEIELQPEPELTLQRLRQICEQPVPNRVLGMRLTGIDDGHIEYHNLRKQLDLAEWHEQHGTGPCGVFKFNDPARFCSPQCAEEGPYDDYTREEVERHAVATDGHSLIFSWR